MTHQASMAVLPSQAPAATQPDGVVLVVVVGSSVPVSPEGVVPSLDGVVALVVAVVVVGSSVPVSPEGVVPPLDGVVALAVAVVVVGSSVPVSPEGVVPGVGGGSVPSIGPPSTEMATSAQP